MHFSLLKTFCPSKLSMYINYYVLLNTKSLSSTSHQSVQWHVVFHMQIWQVRRIYRKYLTSKVFPVSELWVKNTKYVLDISVFLCKYILKVGFIRLYLCIYQEIMAKVKLERVDGAENWLLPKRWTGELIKFLNYPITKN